MAELERRRGCEEQCLSRYHLLAVHAVVAKQTWPSTVLKIRSGSWGCASGLGVGCLARGPGSATEDHLSDVRSRRLPVFIPDVILHSTPYLASDSRLVDSPTCTTEAPCP
jgi:hypothetical protein